MNLARCSLHRYLRSLGAGLGRPPLEEVLMSFASRGLAPREGLEFVDVLAGPYQAVDEAMPWATGRQVWVPPFPELRHFVHACFKQSLQPGILISNSSGILT